MDALTLTARKAQLADLQRQIEGHRKAIDDAMETMGTLIDAPEVRTCIAAIKQVCTRYTTSLAKVLKLMEEGRQDEAISLMNTEALPALDALHEPVKVLLELQKKNIPVGNARIKQQLDSALTMMTVLEGAPAAVWQSSSGDFLRPLAGE